MPVEVSLGDIKTSYRARWALSLRVKVVNLIALMQLKERKKREEHLLNQDQERDQEMMHHLVVNKTGTALTNGLPRTRTNFHANSRMMTNAGGIGLRRTPHAKQKTKSAGNPLRGTTWRVKEETTYQLLKDHLVVTKTSSAGKDGAVKTQRNYPVRLMVAMTNAGRESLRKILLVKTMTKAAGKSLKKPSETRSKVKKYSQRKKR